MTPERITHLKLAGLGLGGKKKIADALKSLPQTLTLNLPTSVLFQLRHPRLSLTLTCPLSQAISSPPQPVPGPLHMPRGFHPAVREIVLILKCNYVALSG